MMEGGGSGVQPQAMERAAVVGQCDQGPLAGDVGEAAQVEAELLREAGLLRAEGLSEEELKRAKAKVIGQRKIARQELGSLATNTALDELYGLGFANFETEDRKIEAVTLAEVKAAAEKYLQAQTAVISVISPES